MKDIDSVIADALSQGWQHDRTVKGHHQFFAPNGRDIVTTSGTPSDHRAFSNFLSEMKRKGFIMGKRVKRGVARRSIVEYMKRHPGREVPRDELVSYLRSTIPGISDPAIYSNITAVGTGEGYTTTAKGLMYKELNEKPFLPVKNIATPHVGSHAVGEEERELDEALEALVKIERIIRRHRDIARYLTDILRGAK